VTVTVTVNYVTTQCGPAVQPTDKFQFIESLTVRERAFVNIPKDIPTTGALLLRTLNVRANNRSEWEGLRRVATELAAWPAPEGLQ
jgi:hypothetical protein